MIDVNSLNIIEINPSASSVISNIDSQVTILSKSFPDFLWSKFMVAREFNRLFPEYPLEIIEPHDSTSVLIFSRTEDNDIDGVIRVCFDEEKMLPITNYVESAYCSLREKNHHLAEAGRMFVKPNSNAFPYFMACIYVIAIQLNIDFYLIQVRDEHASMYRKVFGAQDISETRPCPGCTHLAWEIAATPSFFLRRFPVDKVSLQLPSYFKEASNG